MSSDFRTRTLPFLTMLVAPALFSTNIIFGRYVSAETEPFVLATIRWAAVALLVAPLALRHDNAALKAVFTNHWRFLVLLAFFGMGICGGGVYLGLEHTTATNATLVYSTAPVLIILLEQLFVGRQTRRREIIGAALAFAGVTVIVARGNWQTLMSLSFNPGDLLIALAALSWAAYSILYRNKRVAGLRNIQLFFLVAIFGALVNLPLAIGQLTRFEGLPQTGNGWLAAGGIVVISSVMAFLAFQYGVRSLGASTAGLFMYLMTPYGVLMAILFLGEALQSFHLPGIALVMTGILIATLPERLFARFAPRTERP